MESKIKILGHPLHPMLIVFPLGLLATAVLFDILYLITGNSDFPVVSFWIMAAGVVGGLLAAVFGFADWLSIPSGTRAKTIGIFHGLGNVVVTALFAMSWYTRFNIITNIPDQTALIYSFAGAVLVLVTAWLGGELVYRLAAGVDRGASLNAPSSLSGRPATDNVRDEMAPGLDRSIPVTGQDPEKGADPDRQG